MNDAGGPESWFSSVAWANLEHAEGMTQRLRPKNERTLSRGSRSKMGTCGFLGRRKEMHIAAKSGIKGLVRLRNVWWGCLS